MGEKSSPVQWQTKAMEHAVEFLEGTQKKYLSLEPDKKLNEEVEWNKELEQMIQFFAPKIRLVGWGLWSERFGLWRSLRQRLGLNTDDIEKAPKSYRQIKSWGGAYTRVMKNCNDSWRCLQYLYIYTRQKGTISFFWNGVVPFLMATWGFALPWFINSLNPDSWLPGYSFEKLLVLMVPFVFLFFEGLRPHFYDIKYSQEEARLQFRATTVLVPFSLLFILGPLSDLFLYGLYAGAAFFVVIWLLEFLTVLPSAHKMDYVPVFVWVAKLDPNKLENQQKIDSYKTMIEREGERQIVDLWYPVCVTWDDGHYHAKTLHYFKEESFISPEIPAVKRASQRLVLDMRDSWHSLGGGPIQFYRRRLRSREYSVISALFICIVWILSFPRLFGSLESLFSFSFSFSSYEITTLLQVFLLACSLAFLSHRSVLVPDGSYSHLDEEKLKTLWNLREASRLKIITKLQNPFMFFETETAQIRATEGEPIPCFDNFNTEPIDLLALMENIRKTRS